MRRTHWIAGVIIILLLAGSVCRAAEGSPQVEFAQNALAAANVEDAVELTITEDPALQPEGFRIARKGDAVVVTATDSAGLMYGGLEVAELARTVGLDAVKPGVHNPHMAMRGIKLNAPLDVRTPSYTDASDTAQFNIPEMWSMDFWKEQIDMLATHRYNFISMWSLHPFPSLVEVPGYEDVALDDVLRSRTIRQSEHYHEGAIGIVSPVILEDAEVVKKLTIDEKVEFWREVMAYGKSRNVDFYFVTWNIFTDGTFGQYGITDKVDNATTRDYFRKSVKQMFLTYPDLAGIGLTTGENMHKVPFAEKEQWAFETYGQGVLDAVKALPGRKIRFIHRQHMADASAVLKQFKPLVDNPDIDFIFSFKYAKAHVYSSVNQVYHQAFVKDLAPRGVKTIWTLRNDDTYQFRWGAPDFVREFVSNIPADVSQGYYFGSDQWIWGREFLQRDAAKPRELELKKHEYQWMLWGRMAYDPTLSNERITAWLADRYELSLDSAAILFEVWQQASMIYPTVTGFHWGPLDFQWYIESCQGRRRFTHNESGFHDVNRFITLAPHKGTDFQSIPDFVNGKNMDRISPLQTAKQIDLYADVAAWPASAWSVKLDSDLAPIFADLEIVAKMGRYYAEKIRGATYLALYREKKNPEDQKRAIAHLVNAARIWSAYTEKVLAIYKNPFWTNRVGIVDLKANYQFVLEDIRIAGGDPIVLGLPAKLDFENEELVRPWEIPNLTVIENNDEK
ncbi:hypothetical protein P4C99_00985 [Pontiellaceae bacterium B1224]|nr:hypothetical protein [Pontiellaceae bacterium B1224]